MPPLSSLRFFPKNKNLFKKQLSSDPLLKGGSRWLEDVPVKFVADGLNPTLVLADASRSAAAKPAKKNAIAAIARLGVRIITRPNKLTRFVKIF